MKPLKILMIAVFMIFGAALFTLPGEVVSAKEKDGKELFKQNCKVCHGKDSPNGEYTPMSLTGDQWKAFFKNKFTDKHKDAVLETEKKKLLEVLTAEDIKTLEKYVVDHAADSEQPQTCSD